MDVSVPCMKILMLVVPDLLCSRADESTLASETAVLLFFFFVWFIFLFKLLLSE